MQRPCPRKKKGRNKREKEHRQTESTGKKKRNNRVYISATRERKRVNYGKGGNCHRGGGFQEKKITMVKKKSVSFAKV